MKDKGEKSSNCVELINLLFFHTFTNKTLKQVWIQVWQQELFSWLLENPDTLQEFSTSCLIVWAKKIGATFNFSLFAHTLHPVHELALWSKIFKIYLFIFTATSLLHAPTISHLALLQKPLSWLPAFTLASHRLFFTAQPDWSSQNRYDHANPFWNRLKQLLPELKNKSSEERMILPINGAGSNG